jgi:VWFA-related protein
MLLSAGGLFAQGGQLTERIDVSAVEVPVVVRDAKGKVPQDLKPSDFILLEDGKPQQIIGLAYPVRAITPSAPGAAGAAIQPLPVMVQKRWRIVIFLQQSLSSTHGLRESVKALVPRAAELVALGEVEIAGDGGKAPHVIAPPTADAAVLRSTLQSLAANVTAMEQIVRIRRDFLNDAADKSRAGPDDPRKLGGGKRAEQPMRGASLGGGPTRGGQPSERTDAGLTVATARMEALVLRLRQDALLGFLSRYADSGRSRAVLLVGDGYDIEPMRFYDTVSVSEASDVRGLNGGPRQREIAETLAAAGWTAISFAPEWKANSFAPAFDVSNGGKGRLAKFAFAGINEAKSSPSGLNLDPLGPLRMLAEETGGSVQTDPSKLSDDLEQMAGRLVLTYQFHRPRDGKVHHIAVKSLRPGLTVRAQHAIASGTSETLAMARATMIAGDEGERGELPVRCSMNRLASKDPTASTAAVTVYVDSKPLDSIRSTLDAATLRFSVAVRHPRALPFTMTKRMENVNLAKQRKWAVDFQVNYRPGANVAVVAEEISTGAWGGAPCI